MALVLGILGPHRQGDAEDVVQNTFIKVHRHLPRFEFQSKFTTWLYRIAYNTAQDQLRRWVKQVQRGSDQELEDLTASDQHEGPSELAQKAQADRLDQAMLTLNETERIALRCQYWLERSLTDIAEMLGTTETNVKTIVHRARKKLNQALETES